MNTYNLIKSAAAMGTADRYGRVRVAPDYHVRGTDHTAELSCGGALLSPPGTLIKALDDGRVEVGLVSSEKNPEFLSFLNKYLSPDRQAVLLPNGHIRLGEGDGSLEFNTEVTFTERLC